MVITYKTDSKPEAHQLSELFKSSGIKRPVEDLNRIKKMIDNANLIATAWDGDKLIGIARALTDFSYCCYLSDLAVDKEYQNKGIGQALVNIIQNILGEESNIILISSPETIEYYPKIGFDKCPNVYIIHRKK